MSEQNAEVATPEEWQERTGIRIIDPDGWRGAMADITFEEPITRQEFLRRAMWSTVVRWPQQLLDEASPLIIRRRSLPNRLRWAADRLEVAGKNERQVIAFLLRQTADELADSDDLATTEGDT